MAEVIKQMFMATILLTNPATKQMLSDIGPKKLRARLNPVAIVKYIKSYRNNRVDKKVKDFMDWMFVPGPS